MIVLGLGDTNCDCHEVGIGIIERNPITIIENFLVTDE